MGAIVEHKPVLLITAVTSQFPEAFDWAIQKSEAAWGPICLRSERFQFTETEFYKSSMGQGLMKQFLAFESPFDPARIADTKIQSNDWESLYADETDFLVDRPINIDPGYISEAKLVLATTKDRDHRIYLRDGIFAEVTLFFRRNQWTASRWTYPDYQRVDFQEFFTECRKYLRGLIQDYNRRRDPI